MDGGVFLTQHLIGLKDAKSGLSLFWCFNEFITGSQLLITILSCYFSKIENLSEKTVFLQLDNCTGENKNWLLLQYCSMLVEMGKVKEIQVNFLPVGHTHIDIDQVRFLYHFSY